jgi:uncharacterized membrane protein YeaQ/YmgE (transglycosylase-associated protein family)
MGVMALAILVGAAFVIGIAGHFVGRARFDLEWLVATIAAAIGGYVASEYLGTFSAWGPEIDGMFVLPALIGALLLATATDFVSRATGEPAL